MMNVAKLWSIGGGIIENRLCKKLENKQLTKACCVSDGYKIFGCYSNYSVFIVGYIRY